MRDAMNFTRLSCVLLLSTLSLIASCGGSSSNNSNNNTSLHLSVGHINVIHALSDEAAVQAWLGQCETVTEDTENIENEVGSRALSNSQNQNAFSYNQSSGNLWIEIGAKKEISFCALDPDSDIDEDSDANRRFLLKETFNIEEDKVTYLALIDTENGPDLITIPRGVDEHALDNKFNITATNLAADYPQLDLYVLAAGEELSDKGNADFELNYNDDQPSIARDFSATAFELVITERENPSNIYYKSEKKEGHQGTGLAWVITPYFGPIKEGANAKENVLTVSLLAGDRLAAWNQPSELRFVSAVTTEEGMDYFLDEPVQGEQIASSNQYGDISSSVIVDAGSYNLNITQSNQLEPILVEPITIAAGWHYTILSIDIEVDEANTIFIVPVVENAHTVPGQYSLYVTNLFFKAGDYGLFDFLGQFDITNSDLRVYILPEKNGNNTADHVDEQPVGTTAGGVEPAPEDNNLNLTNILPSGFDYLQTLSYNLSLGTYYLWFEVVDRTTPDTEPLTFGPITIDATTAGNEHLLLMKNQSDQSLQERTVFRRLSPLD